MPNTNAMSPPADPTGRRQQDRNVLEREEWNGLRPHKLIAAAGASRSIGDALLGLGAVLMDDIDPRTHGLVALHTCAACNNVYGWNGQVAVVLGNGLLTPSEVARAAIGPTVFEGDDAAILWVVDHVLANREIDALSRDRLGERMVLDVIVATHFYAAIGSIMRGVEPEPEVPEAPGLRTPAEARGTYIEGAA